MFFICFILDLHRCERQAGRRPRLPPSIYGGEEKGGPYMAAGSERWFGVSWPSWRAQPDLRRRQRGSFAYLEGSADSVLTSTRWGCAVFVCGSLLSLRLAGNGWELPEEIFLKIVDFILDGLKLRWGMGDLLSTGGHLESPVGV